MKIVVFHNLEILLLLQSKKKNIPFVSKIPHYRVTPLFHHFFLTILLFFEDYGAAYNRLVTLHVSTNVGKKIDYTEIAQRDHLQPLELEARKLEDLAHKIEQDFTHLKERELRHRDTTGKALMFYVDLIFKMML